mmetsp:Transcript_42498/g.122907  ORF Transcript_42498/g.122907 Transcript_42498/m.122907 type:complete len:204 (-) Transcript_42498:29-640(-)
MAEGPKRSAAASGQLRELRDFSSSSISSEGEMITFFTSGVASGTEKLGSLKPPASASALVASAFGTFGSFLFLLMRMGAAGSSGRGPSTTSCACTGVAATLTARPQAAAKATRAPQLIACSGTGESLGCAAKDWYTLAGRLPRRPLARGLPVDTNAVAAKSHIATPQARAKWLAAWVLRPEAMAVKSGHTKLTLSLGGAAAGT